MQKTLRVTIELEVSDFAPEERKAAAKQAECAVSELPSLEEHTPLAVAEVLESLSVEGLTEEFFAGSELYVRFTDVQMHEAEWV